MPRVTFVLIAAFWVAMNVLLWRAEYGSQNRGTPVPVKLVWRKILTAPDASPLSVYQNGQRTGFCQFSTGVEREMAKLDVNRPPPAGLVSRAGGQIRLEGNVALGDYTNRLRFDGQIKFHPDRVWREFDLKLSTRLATVSIHSLATNQTVSLEMTTADASFHRVFTFTDLQNPIALLHSLAGNSANDPLADFDLPILSQPPTAWAGNIKWKAYRVRLKIGHEQVPAYRLETRVLGQPIVIYASTLGEVLRMELPGGVTAVMEEWNLL